MASQTLLIVGSGPSIALSTALQFASQKFTHIDLIVHTQAKLDNSAAKIKSAHPTVTVSTYTCDVSDTPTLTKTLTAITDTSSYPSLILFNAANVSPSPNLSSSSPDLLTTTAHLTSDFAITTTALYVIASTLLPQMLTLPRPTLLLTGGHIHHLPFPPFFSLSLSKAAQYNLAGSLAAVYGPKGVHVGMVVVNGLVAPEGEMSAESIAKVLWGVYETGAKPGEEGKMSTRELGRVEGGGFLEDGGRGLRN